MKKRNALGNNRGSPQPGRDLWELKERVQIDQCAQTHKQEERTLMSRLANNTHCSDGVTGLGWY